MFLGSCIVWILLSLSVQVLNVRGTVDLSSGSRYDQENEGACCGMWLSSFLFGFLALWIGGLLCFLDCQVPGPGLFEPSLWVLGSPHFP